MSEKAEFPRQYIDAIIQECGLQRQAILHALELMVNGASIPFIARYRKEATDSMDELQLVLVRDSYLKLQAVDERRQAIMTSILEQGKMSEPLLKLLQAAMSKVELEDLYLPYKPKRKTRSSVALEKGLEPLAKSIMGQDFALDIMQEASKFIDPSKGVNTVEEALSGTRDIMADWINETAMARNQIRKLYKNSYIVSNVVEGMAEQGANYSVYFQRREALMKTPSHRVLAMFRGEAEGFLKIRIEPDEQACLNALYFLFVKNTTHSGNQVALAIKDSFKRLMGPSMENEYRKLVKSKAEKAAIKVFAKNLEQLLLAPPLGEKAVLAIDPGFRTGCKVVCLDKQGKLLHNETIFPHPPHNQVSLAIAKILHLVEVYKIEAIAIGNGTAGRETEDFIKKIKFRSPVIAVIVNESGASIYSASVVAREEFGDYDITVRGAVSIGRRLLDPLSELVKVDPKSIGVGQYQHDVNATDLQVALTDTVVSCVNRVGVELNTASKELLSYVSGLTPTVAENIVAYRRENGPFTNREELKKVARLGPKSFEQAAGFLRIANSTNLLDHSAVHPESYYIVEKMASDLHCSIANLMMDLPLRQSVKLEKYVDQKVGMPTLNDIMKELDKPGRDPRTSFSYFEFDPKVRSIEDLEIGMLLHGIVTNITAFGAFVDIGVHQDGLVHVSQMSERFITDPNEVVYLHDPVRVKVIKIDKIRHRVELSMKQAQEMDAHTTNN